jgi:hypothetical protein
MILIEKRLVVVQTIFGFAGGVRGVRVCARRTEPNTPASRSQLLPGWSLARVGGWRGQTEKLDHRCTLTARAEMRPSFISRSLRDAAAVARLCLASRRRRAEQTLHPFLLCGSAQPTNA